jgi:glycosyltransferase involved in cell wall biosynthesis
MVGIPRVHYSAFDVVPSAKGASTHITSFVRGLVRAGADVELVTVGDGRFPAQGEYAGAFIRRVGQDLSENFLARALAFGETVAARLADAGPGAFDLCHFRSAWCGLPLVEAAPRLGYRTVFEVNGLPSVELKHHYPGLRGSPSLERIRHREVLTLLQADAVICPSRVTGAFLESLGVEPERLKIIPNGMDPTLFRPAPLRAPSSPRHLLYVGTLADWQGLVVLLKALPRVREATPVQLHIVGTGRARQRRRLQRWVTRLGLDDCVLVAEPISHEEVPAAIAQADVCVAPLGYSERNVTQGCCPLKIIEYMGVGRPIVAANLPVVRELLRDGIEGLLFEPDCPESLAQQIVRLLTDRELAEALASAAARRAHRSFRWDTAQRSLLELYDQLLGTSLASAPLADRRPCLEPAAFGAWEGDAPPASGP